MCLDRKNFPNELEAARERKITKKIDMENQIHMIGQMYISQLDGPALDDETNDDHFQKAGFSTYAEYRVQKYRTHNA